MQSREAERLLDEHDLIRAHIVAPGVLATWQASDAGYWRRAAIGLAIGAAIPVFGFLMLDWSVATLCAAILLDAVALGIGDLLKGILAPQRVRQEREHLEEAAYVREVMDSLRRPRRPSRMQRDLLAAPPRVGYWFAPLKPIDPALASLAWIMLVLVIGLLALGLVAVAHLLPAALPWLLLGVVLRICGSIVSTLRAARRSDSQPVLLPESPGPMLAIGIVGMFFALALEFAGPAVTSLPPLWSGGVFLVLYFLVALAIGRVTLESLRRFARDLRHFIAQDRDGLRERLLRVNG